MAEQRAALHLDEAEERTEDFRKSLQESRVRRQSDRVTKIETVKLRAENKVLKDRCDRY